MSGLKPMAVLRGLFDINFRTLVTPYIVGLAFVLTLVFVGIGYIANTLTIFSDNAGYGVAYLLLIGPLLAAISVMSYRMWFELMVVLFRIWSIRHDRVELLKIVGREG